MNIKAIESAENEIKRLEKINGELLESLKAVDVFMNVFHIGNPLNEKIRQAIAHAETVTKGEL